MRLLTSWKEIASYLGRTTRTVQRWERSLSLPVYRTGTISSGIVYAFREDIDRWLAKSGENADASVPPMVNGRLNGCSLDDFIEALPHLAWIADVNGLVEFVNQRWNEYTGQSLTNPFPSGMQDAVHPDDLAPVRHLWKAAVASSEAFEARYRIRAKNGQYRWFVGKANLLRDKEDGLAKWVGTCTDIHDHQGALMDTIQERASNLKGLETTRKFF